MPRAKINLYFTHSNDEDLITTAKVLKIIVGRHVWYNIILYKFYVWYNDFFEQQYFCLSYKSCYVNTFAMMWYNIKQSDVILWKIKLYQAFHLHCHY